MNTRPISAGLFPNVEREDILLALSLLLNPTNWNNGKHIAELKQWFADNFYSKRVYPTNAGRSAFYLLLKAAGIGKGDEVLVQAFTCIGAVEPILWVGATPVYLDIDIKSYNLNPDKLRKRINEKTKAVVVQHTFGIPAKIKTIEKITQDRKLILIEDCAHSLGAKVSGQPLGTFGDAAFFSFGRDKIVSSTFGGAAIIHQPSKFSQMSEIYAETKLPTKRWTFRQLLHPLTSYPILISYRLQLGKALLVLLQRLSLLGKPYVEREYKGIKPDSYPRRLPAPLAKLALQQLNKLSRMNRRRRKIAAQYGKVDKEAVYLRYPLLVDKPEDMYRQAREHGIILGRWYSNIIDPAGTDLTAFAYERGSCPVAEEICGRIINLPTYPRMTGKEIAKIKSFLKIC